ncbi:MAG: hypothetical protein CMK09_16425 [Ponticaulis sp.]|nr:hypothetical protein [Ponticaulis sp.]|tara:strand:+ start:27636 stop:27998 length:363 start_codon:yes stop_codon:yes gene_type:complete
MAGDIDLNPISPVLSAETRSQFETRYRQAVAELDEAEDESFEKADSSEETRQALADALTEAQIEPDGKLVIERDEDTGKFVQKVIDPTSGEVLKQWPEEQFLELAKQMGEAYGLFVDRNV